MKIRMKNQIHLDGQIELIDQIYKVDWTQKGDYQYLVFINEEDEKTVLKFHETELTMTRFSKPKSIMRFVKGEHTLMGIHTPLGLQQFVIETDQYLLDIENQTIYLYYQLKTLAEDQIFASYQMEIFWGDVEKYENMKK